MPPARRFDFRFQLAAFEPVQRTAGSLWEPSLRPGGWRSVMEWMNQPGVSREWFLRLFDEVSISRGAHPRACSHNAQRMAAKRRYRPFTGEAVQLANRPEAATRRPASPRTSLISASASNAPSNKGIMFTDILLKSASDRFLGGHCGRVSPYVATRHRAVLTRISVLGGVIEFETISLLLNWLELGALLAIMFRLSSRHCQLKRPWYARRVGGAAARVG